MRRTYHVGLFILAIVSQVHGIYKLCAFPTMDNVACDRVEEGNSNVSCIRVTDSVDCSEKLKNGLADFALYTADEAVLAGKFIRDYANVIGESRYKKRSSDLNFEDLVVVVRKPFTGSFSDLVGKGYCHPGVGISYKVSDKLMKSFEQAVMPKGDCGDRYTVAEQEIRDLEMFFGPSCRPGKWATDEGLDNKLKRRYSNMCRLCDSPQQCTNGLLSDGLEKAALDCLTVNGGDIAFVSLNEVYTYFGLRNEPASASPNEYLFLCPNKTVMPINTSTRPCVWASQPWDLLVTRRAVSNELQDKLNVWLADTKKDGSEKWQAHLRKLLLTNYGTFISRSVNSNLPIHQYIDRGVADNDNSRCKREVEWCTTQELEKEKCKWLQAATETLGIQPQIVCPTTINDKWKCLKKVADGSADLVSIPTDDGFIARKVYNLSTVFYEDNLLAGNYKIIAVLQNQNSAIKGFKDLKGGKACFPEYNGLAWMAFANIIKQLGLHGKKCPESFLTEGCAPGAHSTEFSPPGKKPPQHLCNLCPASANTGKCSPSLSRKSRNLRALECLDNNGGVAFINLRAVSSGNRNSQLDPSIDPTKYNVLCTNGSIISGIANIDDDCALARGVQGEVLGRGNRNNVEESDIKELLLQINKWFGTSEDTSRNAISVYGQFKGIDGLLFEEKTISLVDPDDEHYDFINYYRSLLGNVSQTCSGGPGSLRPYTFVGLVVATIAALISVY